MLTYHLEIAWYDIIYPVKDAVRKKRDYVGKIPKLGGGSEPNPLLDVYIYHPKIVIFW